LGWAVRCLPARNIFRNGYAIVRNNVFFGGIAVIQCEYSDIAGKTLSILAQKCEQKRS
jgi:hypothetical protein